MEPKAFIATAANLMFAVVSPIQEQGKVLCFLRYAQLDGQWQKLDTEQANQLLAERHPHYLHHSSRLCADLHAVPLTAISRHFCPRQGLTGLLQTAGEDAVISDLQQLCGLFSENGLDLQHFGVTGSLLVGMQNRHSDIDLVIYDREVFQQTRRLVQALIARQQCQSLGPGDWLDSFQRRGCDMSLDDYIWHEQRKYNKALINGRKFDLSLLMAGELDTRQFNKLGAVQIQARVVDDSLAFDYPAVFVIDHPQIGHVASFTATYTGQAMLGEQIHIAGQLEQDQQGQQRIVVGSSREAIGEFIRVCDD